MFTNQITLAPQATRSLGLTHTLSVLIVDDDVNAVCLLQQAFAVAAPDVPLTCLSSGRETLDYLTEETALQGPPGLLLLDLAMPGVNGFEVLEWLLEHPACRPAEVLVYSGSFLPEDRCRALALGADGFLLKPGSFQELIGDARLLADRLKNGTQFRLP